MPSIAKKSTLTLLLLFSVIDLAHAQFDLGADIVSRYLWRGLDLSGPSAAIQPWVSFSESNFEVGVWSSYNFSPTGATDELDWYASYSVDAFSFTITDYTFPSGGEFDYLDANSHVLELLGAYSGVVDLMAAVNLTNDDDKSLYVELGKSISVKGGDLGLFFGGVTKSDYYLAPDGGVINVGFSASKEIKLTDSFSIPVSGTYVVNPELKKSYFLVGFSL